MPILPALEKGFNTIGIITKSTIGEETEVLRKIVAIIRKYRKNLLFDVHSAPVVTGGKGYEKAEIFNKSDLVIVLGGDGTILKAAACISKKIVPVLGVNMGNLGFMSEIMPYQLDEALKKIFKKNYKLDKRAMLRVTQYRAGRKINTFLAMNDAVINQGLFARLIELKIEIDQRKVASYKADGLIIATPTGSTAHSLSAGGPIVHPSLNALVITPICPSTLAIRPIVIPNNRQVKVTIQTQRRGAYNIGLTMDGQITIPLEYGDEIKMRKSSRQFYMIRLAPKNYYRLLREKLGWSLHTRD
jgi:NAD+ kinase